MKLPAAIFALLCPSFLMAAPIDWSISIEKFNNIYINPKSCTARQMKWSQMECSNFRARALKRFQQEWSKNSYRDGKRVIDNKAADIRVNRELEKCMDDFCERDW